jgi:two-component system probable response regulator PhcQ
MQAAIDAVNTGGIYRYITKPWDPAELEVSLKRGLEFFMVRRERDELLRQQLSVFRNAMIADRILGLGSLARGLSQHIRNGLVAVRTFLDLAPERAGADGVRDQEFWNNYYNLAQGQVDRIVGLLQELWSASDIEGTQFKDSVQIHELVSAVMESQQAGLTEKELSVTNRIPEDLPPLTADEPRLRRLFDLLLKDQVAMLPKGSRMEFSAEMEPGRNGDADMAVIRLVDDGPGLPTDQVRMVFDPFMVRNDSPSEYGINLMACFFIVHHHGGKIEAETRPEGGTQFTIRLPRDPRDMLKPEHSGETLQRMLLNQTGWDEFLGRD